MKRQDFIVDPNAASRHLDLKFNCSEGVAECYWRVLVGIIYLEGPGGGSLESGVLAYNTCSLEVIAGEISAVSLNRRSAQV